MQYVWDSCFFHSFTQHSILWLCQVNMSIELSVIKQSKEGGEARRREKEEKLITLSISIMRSRSERKQACFKFVCDARSLDSRYSNVHLHKYKCLYNQPNSANGDATVEKSILSSMSTQFMYDIVKCYKFIRRNTHRAVLVWWCQKRNAKFSKWIRFKRARECESVKGGVKEFQVALACRG